MQSIIEATSRKNKNIFTIRFLRLRLTLDLKAYSLAWRLSYCANRQAKAFSCAQALLSLIKNLRKGVLLLYKTIRRLSITIFIKRCKRLQTKKT